MQNNDTGLIFLEHLNQARRLNRWIYDYIEPYLGGALLEVGCGIGNITEFLLSDRRRRVTAVDIEPAYIELVTRKFADCPGFRAVRGDITDTGFVLGLGQGAFDTVVCLNVLEHIEDDRKTLEAFRAMLAPGGRLILLCPTHDFLFGSMDRYLGHFRRYSRSRLTQMVADLGWRPIRSLYFNSFSVVGWFVNGKVLHRRHASPGQIRIVELIVPVFRFFEDRVKLPFGLSVLIVAEKP